MFQAAALFVLLVLSFSRRRGPIRTPVEVPRSSPVEFATSMGDLYEKGGAMRAVTDAVKRRVYRMLTNELGLAQDAVKAGPAAIAEAVQKRLGPMSQECAMRLAQHLREANEVDHASVSSRSVMKLVQALNDDIGSLRVMLKPGRAGKDSEKSAVVQELEVAGAKERQ